MSGETSERRHTLLIPLVGPMQSWGSRSRFDDRDTHAEPTKSGVIGLICAALGRSRGESLSDLDALRFGLRVDAGGRAMVDYQTAQEVIRAGGSGTSAVTSRRHYLADARFLVGLQGKDSDLPLLQEIEAALQNPRWPLSLGRKSFPLTVPPFFPEGSLRQEKKLEEALTDEPWRWLRHSEISEKKLPQALRLVVESETGDAVQSDRPVSFATRAFGLRRIHSEYCPLPKEKIPWIPV
jgi:CRISPR system Cascade subunit CasD